MNLLVEQTHTLTAFGETGKTFGDNPFGGGAGCVLKKCCEKYKKKGKYCKSCPKR